MKIKVCVPFYSEFETAKPGLRSVKGDPRFEIEYAQGALISKARNALINGGKSQSIRQDPLPFDYFLFVDSDIGFEKRHVETLLSHDLDIVCSPYKCHAHQGLYQAGMFETPGILKGKFPISQTGLRKVDYCGAGFMLVKASALSRMRYPWFRHGIIEKDGLASEIGEDFGFCMNATDSGLDVWCDFDNPVFHRLRTQESFDFTL
jgi:hypothetical protein